MVSLYKETLVHTELQGLEKVNTPTESSNITIQNIRRMGWKSDAAALKSLLSPERLKSYSMISHLNDDIRMFGYSELAA